MLSILRSQQVTQSLPVMDLCIQPLQPVRSTAFHFTTPTHSRLVGFCGSLTTFSGWQVDIFDSWVNSGQFHRAGLREASFLALLELLVSSHVPSL